MRKRPIRSEFSVKPLDTNFWRTSDYANKVKVGKDKKPPPVSFRTSFQMWEIQVADEAVLIRRICNYLPQDILRSEIINLRKRAEAIDFVIEKMDLRKRTPSIPNYVKIVEQALKQREK